MLNTLAAALFLLQGGRVVSVGETVHGQVSEHSPRSRVAAHTESWGVVCRPGLALRIDAASRWDNVLYVLTPEGAPLSRDDDAGGGTNARLDWTCPDDRTYQVAVVAWHERDAGEYTLRVLDLAQSAQAPRLVAPGTRLLRPDDAVRGSLGADAERYRGHPVVFYGFQCRPGLIVTLNLGADFDNVLYVVGPSGLAAANDDANGTDASLTFTCPDAEWYRIGAGARNVEATGTFRLYVRKMS